MILVLHVSKTAPSADHPLHPSSSVPSLSTAFHHHRDVVTLSGLEKVKHYKPKKTESSNATRSKIPTKSVENLVPIPSESEDFSDIKRERDVPVCDNFTTFSNPLFNPDDDFSSSDDESFSDENVPKEIYSNLLFDEEIISIKIDPHHFNAESDLIESLLNQNTSITSSPKIDSLLEEFSDEFAHINLIPPGINEADFDPEEKICLVEKLLYDNSSPRPPKEFNSKKSNAVIESFSPSVRIIKIHVKDSVTPKENGLHILQSIDQGPFKLGTTRNTLGTTPEGGVLLGPEMPRTYDDLNDNEKKRYDADVHATNIVLQGLPKDIHKLINHNIEAKAIWDNVKMLLTGSELTKEDIESQLYDEFERFKMLPAVKLNKGLKERNYEQLYAYLKQHEKHVAQDRLIIERITPTTSDQLAFVSTIQPYAQSSHVQSHQYSSSSAAL
ncbi:hypothetical protein Tco_0270144 [Tanacetum coccineum]